MTAAVVLLETQAKLLRTPLLVLLVSLACVYGLGIQALGIPLAVALTIALAFAGPVLFGSEYSEGARDYLGTRPLSARKVFWTKWAALTLFGMLAVVALNGALIISGWFARDQVLTERFLAAFTLYVLYLSSAVTILTRDTVRGALYGVPVALVLWAFYFAGCDHLFSSSIYDYSRGDHLRAFHDQDSLVVAGMLVLSPPVALGVLHWVYRIRANHRLTFPIALVVLSTPLAAYAGYSYWTLHTEGETSLHRTGGAIARTLDGDKLLFVRRVHNKNGLWSLDLSNPDSIPAPIQVVGSSKEGQHTVYHRGKFIGRHLFLWNREDGLDIEALGADWISEASYHIDPPDHNWITSIEELDGNRLILKTNATFRRKVDLRSGKIEERPREWIEYDWKEHAEWRMKTFGHVSRGDYHDEYPDYLIELSQETAPEPRVRWRIRVADTNRVVAERLEKGWPSWVQFFKDEWILFSCAVVNEVTMDLIQGNVMEFSPVLDGRNENAEVVDGNRRYILNSAFAGEIEFRLDAGKGYVDTFEARDIVPPSSPSIWVERSEPVETKDVGVIPYLDNFCVDKEVASGFVSELSKIVSSKPIHWPRFFSTHTRGLYYELRLYDTSDLGNIRYVTIPIPKRLLTLADAYKTKGGFWRYLSGDKYRVGDTNIYPKLTLGGGYLCLWVPQLRRVAVWNVTDPAQPRFLGLALIEYGGDHIQWGRSVLTDDANRKAGPTTPIHRADGALGFFLQDSGLIWLQFPELEMEAGS